MCASAASSTASNATAIYDSKDDKQEVSCIINDACNDNDDASNNNTSNYEDKETETVVFFGMPGKP
jgi:hypothetical protein